MTDEIAESQGTSVPEDTGEDVKIEESSASTTEDSSAQPEESEDKPKAKGVQKRIDELTANWRESQRQAEQLMEQNRQLQEALLKNRETPQQPPAPEVTEPKIDDFNSYDEYVAALADFKAEQKVRKILDDQESKRVEAEAAKTREQREREFMARADSYKAERPDFDSVAFNPLLPVTQEMADVINSSENGPKVLYHLGKNMAEAQRIANLPPVMQAAELGRIEARITMPQANLNSAAPDPIEPVGGGDGPGVAKHPSEAKDMAEYVRLRNS